MNIKFSGLLLENPHSQTGNIDETKKPFVIMVVGVNGVGKTTTIGKLAHQFKSQGKKVVLGAADKYIGVGEKMTDLQLFNGEEFVDSFFKKN